MAKKESEKTKKKTSKIIEVTEAELCEYLGLSDRRIRTLSSGGIIVKTKPARYDLKKSVIGYIEFIRESKSEEKKGIDELKCQREAEGLQIDKLKKRKVELQVMQIEKKMLFTEDVISMWADFAAMVKSKLMNMSTKLAPILVGNEDVGEIKSTITNEVIDALNEIADFDISKFQNELILEDESGDDTDESAE